MPPTIPNLTPQSVTIADRWQWKVFLAEFTPDAGYSLEYFFTSLVNSGTPFSFSIPGVADGVGWLFDFDSTTEAQLTAGNYRWAARITATDYSKVVLTGNMIVNPDPSVAGQDLRSPEQKILDAIEAMLGDVASMEQMKYTVSQGGGSRSLEKMSRSELMVLRDRYKAIVLAQQQAARLADGQSKSDGQIRVRFT